jgi:hypothetical protein
MCCVCGDNLRGKEGEGDGDNASIPCTTKEIM